MYPPGVAQVTILNGGTVSEALAMTGSSLVGFVTPAAWTAGALSIEVSLDGVTWLTPYDAAAAQVGVVSSPVVSAAYAVDVVAMLPWAFVRVKSAVAQGADRVFSLIVRPLA